MTAALILPALLASVAPPAAAPERPSQVPESREAAIDRIFYPAFQLQMMLRRPIDAHPFTRRVFASLGQQKACMVYAKAWKNAFDRHLPEWARAYRAAVVSVVPDAALRTEPRRFMDPAVTNVYSDRVVTALKGSDAITVVRAMGGEILAELQAAAPAGAPADAPPLVEADAPGGIAAKCGVSLNYLEGRPNALGS